MDIDRRALETWLRTHLGPARIAYSSRATCWWGHLTVPRGWALDEAPDDQLAALDTFEKQFGKTKRVIAWGDSMGGLTTIALVENHADRIDGALPMCGSVVGVGGVMNQAPDASFALKTLVDPADNDGA
jgi:pimeloyl-ACP methyl ester carboxylesterase